MMPKVFSTVKESEKKEKDENGRQKHRELRQGTLGKKERGRTTEAKES